MPKPARGDQKLCTQSDCSGTMRFGRERQDVSRAALQREALEGWVCNMDPEHFVRASALSEGIIR